MASSVGHEFMIELLGKHPRLVPDLLGPAFEDQLTHSTVTLGLRRSDATVSQIPPRSCDLCLELYDDAGAPDAHPPAPFMAIVIEVQLGEDKRKPFAWFGYQAHHCARLQVPTVLVVVTNDRDVARWAAGPFSSGHTTLRPLVLGPGDVPAITDIEDAKRSLELAFMSGVVHGKDMIAVRIGLALAHALDASPDVEMGLYWDTFLASLDEAVCKELEMQLQQHWEPRSDWGKDVFAKGMAAGEAKGHADGIAKGEILGLAKGEILGIAKGEILGQVMGRASAVLSLLEIHGHSVPAAIREQVMACTNLVLLERWFRRAAMAHSVEEVLAP